MIRRYFHVKWDVTDRNEKKVGERYTIHRLFPWQSLIAVLSTSRDKYTSENGKHLVPIEVKRV